MIVGDLGTASRRNAALSAVPCSYSLAALSILASRGAAIKKCALLRRRSISGFTAVRAPARFARNSIPRTPVTVRPVLEASWRPSCSSMSTISALSSVAKGDGLSLTLMKLQEEKTKQTGILHLTHFDPLILNSALDQILRNWIRFCATESGCAMSSPATAAGTQRAENCDFSSSRRLMEARFEIGEVLLTASIGKVLGQLLIGIVARQPPFVNEAGKCISRNAGKIGSFPKGQNELRVEGNGELSTQSRLDFRKRQTQAASYGFRNIEVDYHGVGDFPSRASSLKVLPNQLFGKNDSQKGGLAGRSPIPGRVGRMIFPFITGLTRGKTVEGSSGQSMRKDLSCLPPTVI